MTDQYARLKRRIDLLEFRVQVLEESVHAPLRQGIFNLKDTPDVRARLQAIRGLLGHPPAVQEADCPGPALP